MFPYQKRQTTTATTTPGEIEVQKRNRFYKKTPLLQPTVGEWVSEISCKHRLPQARCLFGPLFIRLPVPAEGRLKLLRQFTLCLAIRHPRVNLFNLLFLQELVPDTTEIG
jgi:hypothetical protein